MTIDGNPPADSRLPDLGSPGGSPQASTITMWDVGLVMSQTEITPETFAASLPLERVAPSAVACAELESRLKALRAALEGRWRREGAAVTMVNGKRYIFSGERKWKLVGNPRALLQELKAVVQSPIASSMLDKVIKTYPEDVSHNILNTLEKEDEAAAEIIRKYRVREEGPPHFWLPEEK